MKTFTLLIAVVIVVGIAGWGCHFFTGSLNYSISIENVGNHNIRISRVLLFNTPNGEFQGTSVYSGGNASISPYYNKPQSTCTIYWKELHGRKSTHKTVAVKLPKLFYNRKYPSDLIFFIDSNTENIYVAYNVFDPKIQDFITVDSEGKPFDIKKVNRKAKSISNKESK